MSICDVDGNVRGIGTRFRRMCEGVLYMALLTRQRMVPACWHARCYSLARTSIPGGSDHISGRHPGKEVSMRSTNDRIIYQRGDGSWANKRVGAARAGSVDPTQRAAESAAREMLVRSGGGELMVKGENGRIRSKDTIGGGNDPRWIHDREH